MFILLPWHWTVPSDESVASSWLSHHLEIVFKCLRFFLSKILAQCLVDGRKSLLLGSYCQNYSLPPTIFGGTVIDNTAINGLCACNVLPPHLPPKCLLLFTSAPNSAWPTVTLSYLRTLGSEDQLSNSTVIGYLLFPYYASFYHPHEWDHSVSVSFPLTSLSMIPASSINIVATYMISCFLITE